MCKYHHTHFCSNHAVYGKDLSIDCWNFERFIIFREKMNHHKPLHRLLVCKSCNFNHKTVTLRKNVFQIHSYVFEFCHHQICTQQVPASHEAGPNTSMIELFLIVLNNSPTCICKQTNLMFLREKNHKVQYSEIQFVKWVNLLETNMVQKIQP